MNTLPHRLRESSFRVYEDVISAAVNAFPNTTTIDPSSLGKSSDTVACRLRDAIASYDHFRWSPSKINLIRFLDVRPKLVVSQDKTTGAVVIGPRQRHHLQAPPTISALVGDKPLTHAILSALLLLHEEGVITEPTKVTGTPPDETMLSHYPNVRVEVFDSTSYMLL